MIESVQPVVEDVDDPDEVSHVSNIDGAAGAASAAVSGSEGAASASDPIDTTAVVTPADLSLLEERVNLLLAVTSREQSTVNARLDALQQLDLATIVAAAARDASAAAASAAQSAADAARLVHAAESAIQSAAEVMASTRAVMQTLSSNATIPELLHEHCVTAATSARDTVLSCLDEARDDVAELVRDVAAVKPVVEQAATHARKPGKKK